MKQKEILKKEIEDLRKKVKTYGNLEKTVMTLYNQYCELLNNNTNIIPSSHSKPYKTFDLLIKRKKWKGMKEEITRELIGLKLIIH